MVRVIQFKFQSLRNDAVGHFLMVTMIFLFFSVSLRAEESVSVKSIMEHANTLYAEKKFDDARREFEHVVEIDSGSIPAWRGLGWSYWALGQKEKAYQVWNNLIKAFPDDLPTLLALGKASEQDQHWDEAIDYYARIVKLQPNQSDARMGRARIFIVLNKFQLAEQEAKWVLNNAPSDNNAKSMLADALMGQGHYQEAEVILRDLTQAETIPANLHRLGKTLAGLGKYRQAADVYKNSYKIQADKDTLAAWRGLGASLRKKGQNERAYAIWKNLVKEHPSDIPTLLSIGLASEQDKFWQQGLDYYKQVLQKTPENQVAHLGRARIFFANKDYKSAELELKSILDRSPSNMKAGAVMVENLVAMNRKQEAIEMLQSIVERDPVAKKLNRLGTLLVDLGREKEAINYFRKSLQLDSEDITAIMGLAHSYWNQQDYNKSIKLLQSYLDRHPDNDLVRTRLAEHASADDRWELAEHEWQFLAYKYPEDINRKLKLAHLLHRAGHYEEAIKIANDVITKDPNNINALALLVDDALFAGNIENAIFWSNRLTTIKPKLDRLVLLGKLHIHLGEILDKEEKRQAALIQYSAALQIFRRADKIDPIRSMASVNMINALLHMDKIEQAMKLAQQTYTKYPNLVDVIKLLSASYMRRGDYSAANDMLANNIPFFPNSSRLKQRLAELTYHAGNKEDAFNMLNDILQVSDQQVVPVLLYHGITVSDRQDTVSLKNFRDQLLALKQEGYHPITVNQLLGFFDGKKTLPGKPILITFDDARSDSFKYADPVLAEMEFRATMFVPVGDITYHQPYASVWPTVNKMAANGRWEMQCHGADAQHWIPVNKEGHTGHFLANRMWLAEDGRLENSKEYATRIEKDMILCKDTMARELPEAQISAFAFPYGDQGHRSLSNAPEAFNLNQEIVKKQFSVAFNVDNTYLLTKETPRYLLPRFEVPRTYTGKDLVRQLKIIDPELSTVYKLAHLNVESGRYEQALKNLDRLVKEDVHDKAELLTTTGKILAWSSDHSTARNRLEHAIALRPGDSVIQKQIDILDHRLKPSLQISGLYFEDNDDRKYYSFGPTVQYGVSDRLSLTGYYKYLDFSQKLKQGSLGTGTGKQSYVANGNQFGAQINYELATRSKLSISAGYADFSGHSSPAPAKSSSTFPLGAIKLTAGVGDRLDLSLAADHTYVNTAGAILNGIAFSRVRGKFKLKLLDSLSFSASNAYFNYTENNQRNRTEVELENKVWGDPNITIGAQFIHDDTKNDNTLYWTPNNYRAFSAPVNLKKKWGESLVTKISVVPGMGKETDSSFKFQINGTGSINWNLGDDLSLSLSLNRYQAATYSNFSASFGVFIRF